MNQLIRTAFFYSFNICLIFCNFSLNAKNYFPNSNDELQVLSETNSCTWPALVLLEPDKEGELCHGEYVIVEAFGFSLNGGIPSNLTVSEDYTFSWPGNVEQLSTRKVRIQIDSDMIEHIIKVEYALTVAGMTCYDNASIKFEVFSGCKWPALVELEQDSQDPYCDGDFVVVEAFGYSQNGGIPGGNDVSNDFTFDWDGEIEYLSDRKVKIQLDYEKNNSIIDVEYALTVNGQTCYDYADIQFDILPKFNSDIVDIKWSPGDILKIITDSENLCYQWGKLVDDMEIELEGETENSIATNAGSESIFVTEIIDLEAIPKNTFEEIYFVRIYDCNDGFGVCDLKKYFLPETFQFVELVPEKFLYDLAIYPNPGNGIVYIDDKEFVFKETKIDFEVSNMSGGLILQHGTTYITNKTFLDFSEYPPGLYNIKIILPDSRVENRLYCKE